MTSPNNTPSRTSLPPNSEERKREEKEDLAQGIKLMFFASLIAAILATFVKDTSSSISIWPLVFFAVIFRLIGLGVLFVSGQLKNLKTKHLNWHLLYALSLLSSLYCYFYTLGALNLTDAILLQNTFPLFMPILGSIVLKEHFSHKLWWAVTLGFIGVVCILKPTPTLFQPATLIGVAGGLLMSLTQLSMRKLSKTEPINRILFYVISINAIGATLLLLIFGLHSTATPSTAPALPFGTGWSLIGIGLLGFYYQKLLARAYATAPASKISVFSYLTVVFGAILGWWYWKETPTLATIIGFILICLGGIIVIRLATPKSR